LSGADRHCSPSSPERLPANKAEAAAVPWPGGRA
jgi:hypothetical protein